tara:strand:+ start:1125 stop:1376 length:252 start_codon:yes stop_codon:yes gene_type:complete
LVGEELNVDWLDWLLIEGSEAGATWDGGWAVGAEATTGVAPCTTHCWGETVVEPWSLITGAGAGETGLGIEAWICWLIATGIS